MSHDRRSDSVPSSAPTKLFLQPVPELPLSITVVILKHYRGVNVHFRKRPYLCEGTKCESAIHKLGKQWRGYSPALVYREDSDKYVPCILEVTEHMAACMREWSDLRGTAWECKRAIGDVGKSPKCYATFLESFDQEFVDPAFAVEEFVTRVHRGTAPVWGIKPPLEELLYLEESKLPSPLTIRKQREAAAAERQSQLEGAKIMKDFIASTLGNGKK